MNMSLSCLQILLLKETHSYPQYRSSLFPRVKPHKHDLKYWWSSKESMLEIKARDRVGLMYIN